jgi:hypothetical protein
MYHPTALWAGSGCREHSYGVFGGRYPHFRPMLAVGQNRSQGDQGSAEGVWVSGRAWGSGGHPLRVMCGGMVRCEHDRVGRHPAPRADPGGLLLPERSGPDGAGETLSGIGVLRE